MKKKVDTETCASTRAGVLTWLLRSNLSAAERAAVAEALHPSPPPPILRPPPVRTVEVLKTVEVVRAVPAPKPAEHPVLGELLYDFGRARARAQRHAQPCVHYLLTPLTR